MDNQTNDVLAKNKMNKKNGALNFSRSKKLRKKVHEIIPGGAILMLKEMINIPKVHRRLLVMVKDAMFTM